MRAKEQSVRDALTRIGKLDATAVRPLHASPLELGYRSRLNLRVAGGEVGFFRGATHDLVPIDHCLLAEPEVDAAVPAARELVRALRSDIRRIEIVARGVGPGVVLSGEVEGALVADDASRLEAFLSANRQVAGVVLQGRRWRGSWGQIDTRIAPAEGVDLRLPAGVFTQVNPSANRILVETVLNLGPIDRTDSILELHAGAGNLTLPLAGRASSVVAVEQHRAAALAAIDNSRHLAHVEVRTASAAAALADVIARGERYDIVVLDPPRGGAPEVVNSLLRLAPRRLIYVSCNPTTLARDLARLAPRYRIEAVQPIDMFPHTYHVECVVSSVLT
jgi:23S rRNA (uracil1939-C5)-methyltransferase